MARSLILPGIAIACAIFMGYHLVTTNVHPPMEPPPVAPAASPYAETVAGAGIVEAKTENISVGALLPGVVVERPIVVGQKVEPGDLLFRLDDREARAELSIRQAALQSAESELARLRSMPRPEEIPPSEARVRRAESEYKAAKDLLDRAERLFSKQAIGEEELIQRRETAAAVQQEFNHALADDALLKKGAWESDIQVAQAKVDEARAMRDLAVTNISRLETRSPIEGEILQINVRLGEYVGTPPGQSLVILGDLQTLHVRADIDESDIPDYKPGAPGKAYARGGASRELPLRFVRVEPFVLPKKSLTGSPREQVDTRVLQVIYEIVDPSPGVYVGQQLDVFFEEMNPPVNSEAASQIATKSRP